MKKLFAAVSAVAIATLAVPAFAQTETAPAATDSGAASAPAHHHKAGGHHKKGTHHKKGAHHKAAPAAEAPAASTGTPAPEGAKE